MHGYTTTMAKRYTSASPARERGRMSSSHSIPDGVFPPLEPPKAGTSKQTRWLVLALILLVCGIPGLGLYWLRTHYQVLFMPGSSMEPTIKHGERILCDMKYFRDRLPDHGEVVVFWKEKTLWIKRIAAAPGDTIEGRNGSIYVNGNLVSEPYAQHTGIPRKYMQTFGPIKMKAGEYFVMGDNRDNSLDSRISEFGFVPRAAIIGRPMYILVTEDQDRTWKRIQ